MTRKEEQEEGTVGNGKNKHFQKRTLKKKYKVFSKLNI